LKATTTLLAAHLWGKRKKKEGGKGAEKPFTQRSDVLLTHSQEVFGDF